MRVLFVTPEIYPLIKTGGLADVSAMLPASLAALGVDVQVMVPAYPQVLDEARRHSPTIPLGDIIGVGEVSLIMAKTPDTDIPLWLVNCPQLYRRPGKLYQDHAGGDWSDNDLRYAVLSHAAARLAQGAVDTGWRPDIVHTNDWQTGLVPILLEQSLSSRPATVFTMHNLAFQGLFPLDRAVSLGLSQDNLSPEGVEFYGRLSFLKAGIRYANALTTVSHTYAREIQTPEFGCGLEGLLRHRADYLVGIPNGVDYGLWNPWTDSYLPQRYNVQKMAGKRFCKEALQRELKLTVAADVPLIAFASRVTDQKMADIVADAMPWLVEIGAAQFALVGEGDPALERRFINLAERYPGEVSVHLHYEEPLAHRLHAGADILLHPSRFEPGGLVPLYAMRYGTVPVVRHVGGLADSVVNADPSTIANNTATGFAFTEASATALLGCLERALSLYRQPVAWRRIQRCAMKQDFGWRQPAQTYLSLYQDLVPVSANEAGTAFEGIGRAAPDEIDAESNVLGWADKHSYKEEGSPKLKKERTMNNNLETQIRERAYQIWEQENRPFGKDEEHWLRAKIEIETERTPKKSKQASKKSGTDSPSAAKKTRPKTAVRAKRRT